MLGWSRRPLIMRTMRKPSQSYIEQRAAPFWKRQAGAADVSDSFADPAYDGNRQKALLSDRGYARSMRRRRKLFSGGRVAPRNIYLGPRRTSLRLEAVMWEALADIAQDQDKTVDDVILDLSRERPKDLSLSAAIRVYIVEFYRAQFKGGRRR